MLSNGAAAGTDADNAKAQGTLDTSGTAAGTSGASDPSNHTTESDDETTAAQPALAFGPRGAFVCVQRGDTSKPPITNILCEVVSPLGVPGLVDLKQISLAQEGIAAVDAQIASPTSTEHDILSLVSVITEHASALCFECKAAVDIMAYSMAIRHQYILLGRAVARSATRSVNAIKAFATGLAAENRDRSAAAVQSLAFAAKELFELASRSPGAPVGYSLVRHPVPLQQHLPASSVVPPSPSMRRPSLMPQSYPPAILSPNTLASPMSAFTFSLNDRHDHANEHDSALGSNSLSTVSSSMGLASLQQPISATSTQAALVASRNDVFVALYVTRDPSRAPVTEFAVCSHPNQPLTAQQSQQGFEVVQRVEYQGARAAARAADLQGEAARVTFAMKRVATLAFETGEPATSTAKSGADASDFGSASRATPEVEYSVVILDRYPEKDLPDSPLPVAVPYFCLPDGLIYRHEPLPPVLSAFVLTDSFGDRLYGASLLFYELRRDIDEAAAAAASAAAQPPKPASRPSKGGPNLLARVVQGSSNALTQPQQPEEPPKYVSKCICIISKYAFYAAFRNGLKMLHHNLRHPGDMPIERLIGHLFEVPVPPPGRIAVQIPVGETSAPIVFARPHANDFPFADFSILPLFFCLNLENVVRLFTLLLSETKIIFQSKHYALLNPIAEALCSLMFPFRWQYVFIPICPPVLLDFLQAPLPYIVGVRTGCLDKSTLPSDAVIVDLDKNQIIKMRGVASAGGIALPWKPRQRLLEMLRRDKCAGNLFLKDFSSLHEDVDEHAYSTTASCPPKGPTSSAQVRMKAIREAFLSFFLSMFSNYRDFLTIPTVETIAELDLGNVDSVFDREGFLQSQQAENRTFVKNFLDKMAFSRFVEEHLDVSSRDDELMFFDACVETYKATDGEACVPVIDAKDAVQRIFQMPPPENTGLPPNATYRYPRLLSFNHELFAPLRKHIINFRTTPAVGALQRRTSMGPFDSNHDRTKSSWTTLYADSFLDSDAGAQSADGEKAPPHTSAQTRKRAESSSGLLSSTSNAATAAAAGPGLAVPGASTAPRSRNGTGSSLGFISTGVRLGLEAVHLAAPHQNHATAQQALAESDALPAAQGFLRTVYNVWFMLMCHFIPQAESPEVAFLSTATILERMRLKDVTPDETTFRALLKACAHAGTLPSQAKTVFKMLNNHGIAPNAITTGLFVRAVSGQGESRHGVSSFARDATTGRIINWFHNFVALDRMTIDGTNMCTGCRRVVSDEEILAGWAATRSAFKTRCPRCGEGFVPTLSWRPSTTVERGEQPIGGASTSPAPAPEGHQLDPWLAGNCPYLSPAVLLKEVEMLLFQDHGRDFRKSQSELMREHPSTFWNLAWYFAHLHLPWTLPQITRTSLKIMTRSPTLLNSYLVYEQARASAAATHSPLPATPRFGDAMDSLLSSFLVTGPRVPGMLQHLRTTMCDPEREVIRVSTQRPDDGSANDDAVVVTAPDASTGTASTAVRGSGTPATPAPRGSLAMPPTAQRPASQQQQQPQQPQQPQQQQQQQQPQQQQPGAQQLPTIVAPPMCPRWIHDQAMYNPSTGTLVVNARVNRGRNQLLGYARVVAATPSSVLSMKDVSAFSQVVADTVLTIQADLEHGLLLDAMDRFLTARIANESKTATFASWFYKGMYVSLLSLAPIGAGMAFPSEREFAETFNREIHHLKPSLLDEYYVDQDGPPQPFVVAFRSVFDFLRPVLRLPWQAAGNPRSSVGWHPLPPAGPVAPPRRRLMPIARALMMGL
ncbi:hypothetical protein, variant [Capsaspora owczarzaki ATCC 30864]|nr:hypothetical protein, variant [Capsaspora owczarzaki ATCC 30864]